MGAFLRLGQVEGRGKGKEQYLAKNQYFHFRGGHFVYMSGAGAVAGNKRAASLCASGVGDTTIAGWLVAPRQDNGKTGFKVVNSGTDKGFLINGFEDVFAIRPDEVDASMAASWIGYGMGIKNTGATYNLIQRATYKKSTTATPLACVDVDVEHKILYVRIKNHQPA